MSEFVVENEVREGEEFGNSAENAGNTLMSVSSSNKRIKEMSIDRLSALPDSILIHTHYSRYEGSCDDCCVVEKMAISLD